MIQSNRKRPYKTTTSYYRKVKQSKILIKNTRNESSCKTSNCLIYVNTGSVLNDQIEKSDFEQGSVNKISQCSEILNNIETSSNSDSELVDSDNSENEDLVKKTEEKLSLMDQLRVWALSSKISHLTLNQLLNILRMNQFDFLPKDSRTLLRTPNYIPNLITMLNGQYWYNGLEKNLINLLSQVKCPPVVSLVLNIDGLPIAKSSKMEFWPILCAIDEVSDVPIFPIAIYCGETKPALKPFLEPFVNEIQLLLKNGINVDGQKTSVKIKYFVCDTPARAFVKGVVNFNSYHGCTRCTVVGDYELKRMSFCRINCPKRTDVDFRNRKDEDHHKELTPLEDLPIDMVNDFIVADSLHLLHLGVMKKLLIIWTFGKHTYNTKWSGNTIISVSNLLCMMNKTLPFEIHRSIRTLDCLKFWKGVEYSTFLMYLGPVILKDVLPEEVYEHFLLLFCVVTICSCNEYKVYVNIAKFLIEEFIEKYIEIYGSDSVTSNVHNLCHMVDDVLKFGILPAISSYRFENYLGLIKNLLRQGHRPLAQCAKRIIEISKIGINPIIREICPIVKDEIKNQILSSSHRGKEFKKIVVSKDIVLKNDPKNKWFLTKQNEIVSMISACLCADELQIYGSSISVEKQMFFEKPIKSSFLNIYSCDEVLNPPQHYRLSEIKCKLFSLKYHEKLVFLPLLHSFDTFK